jgi:RNA recognition motif-containing protein
MQYATGDQQQNLIYLYDLPREETDSKRIAIAFKERANILLETKPQIKKNITTPFYSAIVSIKDPIAFNKACEAMKYFEIEGKPCRALQFDKQLLGSNKEKLLAHNVFIKNVPKELKHSDLQKKFEGLGKIKSLKVSLNADHTSRGYGFICFQDEATATKAVEFSKEDGEVVAVKFEPKDRRSFRKLNNNVYVKNLPLEKTDADVKAMFAAYGNIKSLVLQKNPIGQYGFVCYDEPEGVNKEYGPECAAKAIEGLHGQDMGNELKLYVRAAMKKTDRELEKKRDTLRYKTSKKRCNLYVKNFPNTWTSDDLQNLFKQFGAIENIKLEKGRNGSFAFVCFKQPDSAAVAKQTLNNSTYDGKTLMINHYEIKEQRKIQIEDAIDKADFEKYQAQQSGAFHLADLTSHPHMTQILQQLLDIMQQNQAMSSHFNQSERNMGGGNMRQGGGQGGRRPYQQGQRPPNGGQQYPPRGNMPQGMPMQQQPQMGPGGMGGMPGVPQSMMAPQAPMAMPPAGMASAPQGAAGQNPMVMQYLQVCGRLLPSVTEKNPYLKEKVGEAIFPTIRTLVGNERAPKITGMLIELPVEQIKAYMSNFDNLHCKVKEASDLIDQSDK